MDYRQLSSKELESILDRDEGHFFDIKAKQVSPARIERALVAFANADGGELYIGIRDKKETDRVDGFESEEEMNGVFQAINRIVPPISTLSREVVAYDYQGKQGLLLHFVVEKSPDVHFTSDNRCYRRDGAQCLPVEGPRIQELTFAKGQKSYEDVIIESYTLDELCDSNYLRNYLDQIRTVQDPAAFLLTQRVAIRDPHTRNPRVTAGGVILFADLPQAILPTKCAVKVIRLRTSGTEYSRDVLGETITVEGPAAELIEGAKAAVNQMLENVMYERREGFVRLKYPTEALHELITNAVIHRDYSIKEDIQVRIYDNRIEIQSPGRLPGHVTPTNILTERFARNKNLVRLLHKLPNPPNKDIGEGIDTVFLSMKRAKLKPPVIQEVGNSVVVTLLHESIASAAELIIEYLEKNGTINNRTARAITGEKSENKIKRTFLKMRDRGILVPANPDSTRFKREWKLAPDYRERIAATGSPE